MAKVKGTIITQKRKDYSITRNVSYFKTYLQDNHTTGRERRHGYEAEDEDTIDQVPRMQEQPPSDPEPRRYPERGETRPIYYSGVS